MMPYRGDTVQPRPRSPQVWPIPDGAWRVLRRVRSRWHALPSHERPSLEPHNLLTILQRGEFDALRRGGCLPMTAGLERWFCSPPAEVEEIDPLALLAGLARLRREYPREFALLLQAALQGGCRA